MKNPLQKPLYSQSLVVDLYELTMAAAYHENDFNEPATFEMFVRDMPGKRNYLVAAGLCQVLEYLDDLRFETGEIEYLRDLPVFRHVQDTFWKYLSNFHFSGEVWAVPEGQIVFAGEPLLRVTAPIIEAQIVETFLLSMVNFQTMIASKAARVVHAAGLDGKSRGVMEFGSRRAHGPQSSLLAARAAYIGGCMGTSNTLAGKLFNIPVMGTAAHSWVMAFPSEREAFQAYFKVFPEHTILLIDTYDISRGAQTAAEISSQIKGVRIDSGDLLQESRKVRSILDEQGLQQVQIVASGDLDEYRIQALVQKGAPIDSYGVGTQLATSADEPYLGGIYKLVQQDINGEVRLRAKFSPHKSTYPGKKQIYRVMDDEGCFRKDIIGLVMDNIQEDCEELLVQVMKEGKLIYRLPSLSESREFFYNNLDKVPPRLKALHKVEDYPVAYSSKLQQLHDDLKQQAH
ncbi:MAG: nicotinate phosphoribosyltransferase [Calditrichia bacterium]